MRRVIIIATFIVVVLILAEHVAAKTAGFDDPAFATGGTIDIKAILDRVTTVAFGLLMSLAVLFGLWAGFQYLTSGGDATKIQGASKTLIYAAVAGGVGALAKVLMNFVTDFLVSGIKPF